MIYELLIAGGVFGTTHYGPTVVNYARHYLRASIDISGDWEIVQSQITEDGGELRKSWTTKISIKQVGKKISGNAVSHPVNHDSRSVHYSVEGHFENNYLSVVFRDLEKHRFSVSVFLLKVENEGTSLVGHRVFSGALEDRAKTIECSWRKPGLGASDVGCGRQIGSLPTSPI